MSGFKTILLVDDDASTNFLNRILLEEWEIAERIFEAGNGRMALDLLKNSPDFPGEAPALILLDINMPEMNGFEFLEHYENLSLELKSKMHVVILSTSLHPEDRQKAAGFGALDGYLHKPLSLDKLVEIFPNQLSN